MRTIIVPSLPPPRGHYSHATIHNGFIFTAGILPLIPGKDRRISTDIDEQIRQCFANLQEVLLTSGSSLHHLLSLQCFITDMTHWSTFDRISQEVFGEHRPARAVIPVGSFQNPAILELQGIAALPHQEHKA